MEKRPDVWYLLAIFGAIVAQAHTVRKGERGIVEGWAERTAHLISLFGVNLFTCGKLSHRRNCKSY